MTLWEELEAYLTHLIQQGVSGFNSMDVARTLRVTPQRASYMIQAYLKAQRNPNSMTLYTLSRQGRTRTTVWHIGARTHNVRAMTRQCMNDISVKVTEALTPDLRRMGVLNPRVAQMTEAMVQVFVANVNLLGTQIP